MKARKEVIVLTGAGQLGMAIVRRIGFGKKIFIADWKFENANAISITLMEAGFDVTPLAIDISSKQSVLTLIQTAQQEGEITMFINAAGVSPSQATIEQILQVDLYGTALLLEEFGKVIKSGGSAITISSQSGHRLAALTPQEDKLLATTSSDQLLDLEILKLDAIKDTLHAYQMAKYCNAKRVMFEAVNWGKKNARINSISPGIIITPLALDELNGPRSEFYKKMLDNSPVGRAGTSDEVAALAEFILSESGSYITGSDFLIDGGATAFHFYGTN